ncbi:MAG: peptidase [Desulfobacteraceae bacterium]|nr:peptidase [Desulfobacteraceae bacterium]
MKISAPVNSFEAARHLIEKGAREIYTGMGDDYLKRLSFSGRGKVSVHCQSLLPDHQDLSNIIRYAHAHNVKVNFTANIPILPEGMADRELQEKYLDHVKAATDLNVDSIIVGDLGALLLVRQLDTGIPLHASTFFDTINSQQLIFLHSLGVERTILSYHVTLEEIETMTKQNIHDIEVIGFMGCSFFNGCCHLIHCMGETDQQEPVVLGVPCKSIYRVDDGQKVSESQFMDFELGCSLCLLKTLVDYQVTTIKIVGRSRDYEETGQIVSIMSQALQMVNEYHATEYKQKVQEIIPTWWKRFWCRKGRCKFAPVKNDHHFFKYYIGANETLREPANYDRVKYI